MSPLRKYSHLITIVIFTIFPLRTEAGANSLNKQIKTVLTNCNIISCSGSKLMKNMTITIKGNRISEIKRGKYKSVDNDKNSKVIDLGGSYVLPGFWNMHMHLSGLLPDPNHVQDNESTASATIRAGLNAMDGIRHGFTSIRSVGERDYIDIAWRDAFNQGYFMGPRIFASGEPVTATGGHRGDVEFGSDGVPEIRKAVRQRIQNGVDWIKIVDVELLPDELEAAIETTHSLGRKITSHSREPATYRSVLAGVDCIEHGYGLTDKTIKLMAEKGVYYSPTIICNLSDAYIKEREARLARLGFAEDEEVVNGRVLVAYADERSQVHAEYQRNALKKAIKSGVKVVIASDSTPIGEIGILEIEQFVLSGVSEMDALIAATRNPAEMCGVLDKLGTVEENKLADLVIIKDNPLENISNIRNIEMVFKDGVSVDLTHPQGTATYWDYYGKKNLKKGYLGDAENQAGFTRGLADPVNN
ncbi:MAG: amidohydrolase family protein [Candidatus Marinimicrobia bacterium]|jgi:imidazolonepropionase-like amidohydrolase|nr:amidohydrolase family protein [Candidatus Neomarinimicrobiota bacterium]|tara:strand:- start:1941 stop:3359 length:1419 start_codon:yes stop_codon:yes gene_type:complete